MVLPYVFGLDVGLESSVGLQDIVRLKKLGLRNKVLLEASGGINSKNIQAFAKTGVDMISVGEITNSVKGIDFSLEVS